MNFPKKILFLMIFALSACTVPQSPSQAVYMVESNYATALRTELAYSSLPRCGKPTSPKLCSDIKIIKNLQLADDVAWDAIQKAQEAVRTPAFGEDKIATAIASAKALVGSFVKITQTLGDK